MKAGTLITKEKDFTVCITYEVSLVAGGQRLYTDTIATSRESAFVGNCSGWQ